MIRPISLSLALLGLLFNTANAAGPQEDVCKVEQDHINTAVFLEGAMTQTFRACSKGTISYVEVIASAEFNGGTIDISIMDENFVKRAMHTFTADNYNGSSLVLDNLSIPTLQDDQFTFMIRTNDGASCVIPGTDDANNFVGDARLYGQPLNKNVKFVTGVRGATPNLNGLNEGRKEDGTVNPLPNNAMSRSFAGLDLEVSGDCTMAQRETNGVLNVNGGGMFLQTFQTCERGRIVEAKIAAPFVEPGYEFNYELMYFNGERIASGTFTSEDATDGELKLTFDKGSVRKNQTVAIRVNCPEGARIALLARGVAGPDFGRLFINGQSFSYNIAMAAGLDVALAEDVLSTDDGRAALEISAYPIPFGDDLKVQVRGNVEAGALLQVLDHQGMPVASLTLAAGPVEGPIHLEELGDLRPGIYSLRLLSGRQAVSIRILKG